MLTLDLSSLAAPVLIRPAVPLTDEELIRFSEVNKPYRFERNKYGEIVMMTPVGGIGGTNEMRVAGALANWTDETGTGVSFSPNTGFNLPDGSCLSPDAAWVSLARWNALTPAEQAGFPPLCPEFLIEVRSRSDSRRMVEEKMQLWLDNGAQLAWLVDPIDANVTIYSPGQPARTLERPEVVEAGEPVAGFVLRAERLWPKILGEQMEYQIEFEQEDDGRWIAEIPTLPGVMAYGVSKAEAESKVAALALSVIADRNAFEEQV